MIGQKHFWAESFYWAVINLSRICLCHKNKCVYLCLVSTYYGHQCAWNPSSSVSLANHSKGTHFEFFINRGCCSVSIIQFCETKSQTTMKVLVSTKTYSNIKITSILKMFYETQTIIILPENTYYKNYLFIYLHL